MGLDLYQAFPQARELFDRADRVLGFSLREICFEGPQERLNHDLNAQLAVYTVSCALTRILRSQGILPHQVTGYSSGFYAAAYAAGCYDYADGLSLVRKAGETLLQEGGKTKGSMGLIFGLPLEAVKRICQGVGDVEVAIINTPRQIVVSGRSPSVAAAMSEAEKAGALDVYPLPVAIAYHSRFMATSGARLQRDIQDGRFRDPEIPLISYLSLEAIPDQKSLRKVLTAQLSRPVFWVDLIRKLLRSDPALLVEVGPGAVISRTVKWINRSVEVVTTNTKDGLLKALERCHHMGSLPKGSRHHDAVSTVHEGTG
jgi:[acyl-carrier-protein] S-malonyltransferase